MFCLLGLLDCPDLFQLMFIPGALFLVLSLCFFSLIVSFPARSGGVSFSGHDAADSALKAFFGHRRNRQGKGEKSYLKPV